MKKVFITGISGMLGSNLAFNLKEKYEIFGMDRNEFKMKNIHSEVGTIEEISRIEELIVNFNIDTLIHCAAMVNVDLCEQNPIEAESINVKATNALRIICHKHNVKFVFISSDAVYDGRYVELSKETDKVLPINAYAKTKLIAEENSLESKDSLIIRTNMYGFNYRDKKSFSEWVVNSLAEEKELSMFNDVYCSPILVNNLVKIIELSIIENLKGVYNIGSRNRIDKYTLGVLIKNLFGLKGEIKSISVNEFDFVAERTRNMGLDCSKIENDLGIKLNTVQEDLIEYKYLYDNNYPEKLKLGDNIN